MHSRDYLLPGHFPPGVGGGGGGPGGPGGPGGEGGPVVEPIGPNLMLEYVTCACGSYRGTHLRMNRV